MEEAAQNLGCSGGRLFRRIVFPLAMPGYVAGASLVFIKVFDDLATPLLLNVKDMLAPQAYLRITSIGLKDPRGYVISVVLMSFRAVALHCDLGHAQPGLCHGAARGGGGLTKRRIHGLDLALAWGTIGLILTLVLAPHFGLLLLSVSTVWSFSVLPDGYTTAHYILVIMESGLVVIGTRCSMPRWPASSCHHWHRISYIVLRTKVRGRQMVGLPRERRLGRARRGARHRLSPRAIYGVSLPSANRSRASGSSS